MRGKVGVRGRGRFVCIMPASQGSEAKARVSMRTWDAGRGGGGRGGSAG